jgi:hypothetical protein
MIKAYTTAAMLLLLAPSAALAQNRAGDAALGALAGAVVLGPVGAVAGAFVGYSAGPAISRSWGIDGSRSSRHRRQASRDGVRAARAEAVSTGNPGADALRSDVKGSAPRARSNARSFPPVQTLE